MNEPRHGAADTMEGLRRIGSVAVTGVGLWSPSWPGWSAAQSAWRGATTIEVLRSDAPAGPPPTDLLPPAERRRAPATVHLALTVAHAACRQAGRDPRRLPSVFASAHGDVEITDYLCTVLASSPEHLSPTRFHHSVHNAPAGYWTIATGSMEPSTALAAGRHSVGAGLVEAATIALAESRPVLLVVYDLPATGALASVTRSDLLFGAALVLEPTACEGQREPVAALTLSTAMGQHSAGAGPADGLSGAWHAESRRTPAARLLPVLAAMLGDSPRRVLLPIGDTLDASPDGEGVDTPWPASTQLVIDLVPGAPGHGGVHDRPAAAGRPPIA